MRGMRTFFIAALAFAGVSCRENSPVGPGLPTRTSLSVAPVFEVVEGGPVITLATARVRVFRLTSGAARIEVKDTTAAFTPGSAALSLNISVVVLGGTDEFELEITAMDAAGNVMYSATQTVTVNAGAAPGVPSPILLEYAGADTALATLTVEPRDSVITALEPFTFRVVGRRSDNSAIPVNVGWTSTDPEKLQIDRVTGVATALTQFSNVMVIATMATRKADTTFVSATQPVALVTVSPTTASFFVGATQQLNAQVQAAGGVPLPTRPVHWESDNEAVATVSSSGLVTGVAPGSANIKASSGGQSATAAITIAKRAPTITWPTPADITFGTALSATQLNATATFNGVPVPGSFFYIPTAGTVLQAGARQLAVSFTPADQATFASSAAAVTINVLKAAQTITFNALQDRVFGEPDFTVTASASSSLAVTFAASGQCTVSGVTIHLTGSGSCTVTASQAGDANRNAAPDVARTFNISRATVGLVAASANGVFGGTTTLSATLTAGGAPMADKSVSFTLNGVAVGTALTNASGVATVTNASLTGINAGSYAGAVSPASGVVASFAGDANFNAAQAVATLLVTKATATLTLGTLNFVYDGTPKPVSVTVTPVEASGVNITYNGLATAPSAAGSYSVVGSLTNPNYQANDVGGTLVIGKASQTLSFGALANKRLGDPDFTVSATATSGLAVTFSASGACTVTGNTVTLTAEGQCSITAEQAGNANYQAATSITQTFSVAPRPVASVEVQPPSVVVQTGESAMLTATPRDANNQVLTGRQTAWSSANNGIATVVDGLVTGVSVGQTTITAIIEGVSASATVDVQAPPPLVTSTVLATEEHDTLFSIGARRLLVAQSFNGDALVAGNYTWSSTNSGVAAVDQFGYVTSVSNGTASVIVTEAGGTADTVEIVVLQKLAKIMLTPAIAKMVIGDTRTFTATGYDGLNSPMSLPGQVEWDNSEGYEEVIEVDPVTGVTKANELGNATVIARSGGLEGRALIEVGTLVRRIAIAPSATEMNSLGISASFTATAYDVNDNPLTGIEIEWESQNESVARVTAIDGVNATVTSFTNGVALVRARAQGVQSEVPVTVSQVLSSIVVSPSNVTIDVGGMAVTTAQGRDANDRPMSLGASGVTWDSPTPALLTVNAASGVITAVGEGAATVRATSVVNPSIQGSTGVTVNSDLQGVLSFSSGVISMSGAERVPVTIYLNRKEPASFSVALGVSNGDIAEWETSTVTFGVNETAKTAYLVGKRAGTANLMATDLRDPAYFTAAAAVVSVQPTAFITNMEEQLLAGDEFQTRVQLSVPAPAGGTWVTFAFSSAGAVKVDPSPAFIPAGQVAADIVVHGLSAGTTTITPQIAGNAGTATQPIEIFPIGLMVNLPETPRIIGAGQFEFGGSGFGGCSECCEICQKAQPLTRAQRGPARVTTKAALNSDSTVKKAPVRVPTGIGTWAEYFYTDSCEGFDVEIGGVSEIGIEDNYGEYGPTADLCVGVAAEPQKPIEVLLSSSNQSVALVEQELLLSGVAASFGVNGRSPGSATITAAVLGWPSVSIPLIVTTPKLSAYAYGDEVVNDQIILRDSSELYLDVSVADSLGNEHPLVNSLRVRLTSSNSAVVRIVDSVVVLPAGDSYWADYVRLAPVGPGSAWIQVRSDGHKSDSIYVSVPSRGLLVEKDIVLGAGQYREMTIRTALNEPEVTEVSITSTTDTSSAAIDRTLTMSPGSSLHYIYVRGFTPGVTNFVVSAAGFAPETVTVTVTTPRIMVSPTFVTLGTGDTYAYLVIADSTGAERALMNGITVNLSTLNAGIATVEPTAEVPAGYSNVAVLVTGVGFGTTSLLAQRSGYLPDTAVIAVARPAIELQNAANVQVGVGTRYDYQGYFPYIYVPVSIPEGDSIVFFVTQKRSGIIGLASERLVRYWNDYSDQTVIEFAGLAAGIDTVIVTDSSGLLLPDTMAVSVYPTQFSIAASFDEETNLINEIFSRSVSVAVPYSWRFGQRIAVRLRSSDTTVAKPSSEYVVVNAGDYYLGADFNLVGNGTAFLYVEDSAGVIGSDSIRLHVHGTRLATSTPYIGLGVGQRTGEYDGGHVSIPFYSETGVTVWLSSSDSTIASVPESVYLPGGYSDAYFEVTAHDTIGVVRITMMMDGVEPAYMDVDVRRPQIGMYLSRNRDAGEQSSMSVLAQDFLGNTRIVNEDLTVLIATSDPAVAGADSVQVTIPAGQSAVYDASIMSYRSPGRTTFTARDSRYPALNGYKPYIDTIRVSAPPLIAAYPQYSYLGFNQVGDMHIMVNTNLSGPLTVTVSSSNSGVATVPSTATIPADGESANEVLIPLTGVGEGQATITMTAPGFRPTTWGTSVTKGNLVFESEPYLVLGDSMRVRLLSLTPYTYQYGRVASSTSFSLGGTNVKYTLDGTTTEVTSVTMSAGDHHSAYFWIKPLAPGQAQMTASNSNFVQLQSTVTVVEPASPSLSMAPPANVATGK